jgi:DTW domain-containing protein YfiP
MVVLDATWRKSRKMLHLNPALQALPRLACEHAGFELPDPQGHAPDQLSSLEAAPTRWGR